MVDGVRTVPRPFYYVRVHVHVHVMGTVGIDQLEPTRTHMLFWRSAENTRTI